MTAATARTKPAPLDQSPAITPAATSRDALFDADVLRKLEYLNLIARKVIFGRRQALRESPDKGASIEFRDFRQYSPGDDPRTVDWSVYARLGELMIKLFRQEKELNLQILLDCSGSMNFGSPNKFDQARRLAAALAYIGLANMDSASLFPFDDTLGSGVPRLRGKGNVFRMLEFLGPLPASGETDLETAVAGFLSRVRRPSLVIIISDFYGLRRSFEPLDRLRFYKHQIQVMQVASPWEIEPNLRGELRLVDTESAAHQDLTITDGMLRRYTEAFNALGESLRTYSMKYGIGYTRARSDEPFDVLMRSMLERGGLLI